MHDSQRTLLRTAERIASHLQRIRAAPLSVDLPEGDWSHCQSLLRQIELCANRKWNHAAALLNERLEGAIESCSDRLQEISRNVSAARRHLAPQSAREIFRDLLALSDEFEGLTIDGSNQTLSVRTQSIVLEEIELGPFEIQLHWGRIGDRRPYEVVALEPNPAGESSETTHPHVMNEQLCEGDGRVSIDRALRAGRLLDFFQIVSRILDTYNSGSAYVSLSDWNGNPCADCGAVVSEDDEYSCDRCGDRLCHDCPSSCVRCEALCCHSCTTCCRSCQESVCSGCQQDCGQCRRLVCNSCLSETGLCQECQEEHDAESFDEDEQPFPPVEAETSAPSATGEPNPDEATAQIAV
jgi:hypothetical protein